MQYKQAHEFTTIEKVAQMARDAGYIIYNYSEKGFKFGPEDGSRFASVSMDYFKYVVVSSCHMPCRKHGTGFQVAKDDTETINAETLREALRDAPAWAYKNGRRINVKKPTVADCGNNYYYSEPLVAEKRAEAVK
ncbi:MAG: hypothetical protein MJH10_20550 [Epibacterium sp.]|nr:hypothetical protein [Epibacterium sp.]NQX75858.1 hypothetical protein [Epibacterium sp.]